METVNSTETLVEEKKWTPDCDSKEFESRAGKWIGKKAEVVSFDKVTPVEIDWLWPGHIPMGMLTLIAGDPGVGKSFLTLFIAATVSRGGEWPGFTAENAETAEKAENKSETLNPKPFDSAQGRQIPIHEITMSQKDCFASLAMTEDPASSPNDYAVATNGQKNGSVIILNNEDSAEKVICPRLAALDADLSKIKTIPFVRHRDKNGNEYTDQFNIITDLIALEETICEMPDIKLIIIDPLSAFFGCLDTHNDTYVRAIMTPITELARKYNVAIVGVMHLNKGSSSKALYRTMGSLAFPAAARAVWLVSGIPGSTNNPRRLFIPVKHNMMEKPATMAFEIKDNRVVFEKEAVDIPAEVVLSSKSNMEAPERDRAIAWLKKLLAGGKEMPTQKIEKLAAAEGFREHTLRKAREEIGIKCFPEYDEQGNKFWCWKLKEPMRIPGLAEMNRNALRMLENLEKPRFASGSL